MTIKETTKYLIFSCDELKVESEKEVVWYNSYDGGDDLKRRVDETSPDWRNHYREVIVTWSKYDSDSQFRNYLKNLSEIFGTGSVFIEEVKEQILTSLGDILGDGVLMRHAYSGKVTNRWGEEKIVLNGDPLDPNKWDLWVDDNKIEKKIRKGDRYTYKMTPELLRIIRQVVEDKDDDYPVEVFSFQKGAAPDDLHEKTNSYLVCDKAHLKEKFDHLGDIVNLQMKTDEKEVIRLVDNQATIQQIISSDDIQEGVNSDSDNINDYNQKIQDYNKQMSEKIKDFQDRTFALFMEADKQIEALVSLDKEKLPEVVMQVNLIFDAKKWMKDKEELKGDNQDLVRKTNNQQTETSNTQLIQEWEDKFLLKKAAVEELKKIVVRLTSSDTPEKKSNDPGKDLPVNPTVENNQKSEQNIKDIDNTSSVAEAQAKARTEINTLFERYGVKAEQLSTSLWENESGWETYLTTKCSSVDKVGQFVKKIKIAILQQNKWNHQVNQKLPVQQLKTKIKQDIEALLKKHPNLKTDQNSTLKDWKKKLESENDKTKLMNLEKQFREAIVSASRQNNSLTTKNPKPTWPKKLFIGGSILFGIIALGLLAVVVRNKRVKRLKRGN